MLPARIKAGPVSVTGVKDAGKPATLATSEAGTVIPLPEGSRVTVTKYEPVAATPMAPAQPAKEVTEIAPSGPTEYHKTESTVKADTGTVDTSVRKHQIDVEDRRWLLWAAIVCGIAGVVLKSMLPGWGGLSNGLLIGAALAFGAWKLSDIPAWIWAAVIIVMVAMAAGYKRAEWDKDGDGVPDFLQKPKQPPQ
jgi:hypothetical protein